MSAPPDEVLAAMAEAAADWHLNGHGPVTASCCRIMLERALATADALGWQLVPKEATLPMFRALIANLRKQDDRIAGWGAIGSFAEDYQAMLSAAPKVGE